MHKKCTCFGIGANVLMTSKNKELGSNYVAKFLKNEYANETNGCYKNINLQKVTRKSRLLPLTFWPIRLPVKLYVWAITGFELYPSNWRKIQRKILFIIYIDGKST